MLPVFRVYPFSFHGTSFTPSGTVLIFSVSKSGIGRTYSLTGSTLITIIGTSQGSMAESSVALPPVWHSSERTMSNKLNIRILENGPDVGWYWEVVTTEKEVVARGVADVHAI